MNNESDLIKKKDRTSLIIGVALLITGLILPFVSASLLPDSIYKSANAYLISGLVNLAGIICALIGFSMSIRYSIYLKLKPLIILINIIRLIYGLFLTYSFVIAIYIYGQSRYQYAGLMVFISLVFVIIAVVLVIKSFILFFKKNLGITVEIPE